MNVSRVVSFGPITKSKKRREPGRFVTLKTGRVIFIPEGQRTKWADVRDRVLASRRGLADLSKEGHVKAKRLPIGVSGIETSYIVEFTDGTRALRKVNRGGSAESEILAYEFSESIGWGIVPETVMAEGEVDITLQRWVEGETAAVVVQGREFIPGEGRVFAKDPRMIMMDNLLGNPDRHPGNILVDEDGKQWAIDNNQAFGGVARRLGDVSWFTKTRSREANADLADAAGDIARWSRTPAYNRYIDRMEELMGGSVAAQFEYNVEDLAKWYGEGDER